MQIDSDLNISIFSGKDEDKETIFKLLKESESKYNYDPSERIVKEPRPMSVEGGLKKNGDDSNS